MEKLVEILGQELFDQVSEKMGDQKLIINDGNYIPKQKFDEANNSKNVLKDQVSELTTQLETLKKSAKGNEELERTIEALQATNTDWSNKYQMNILENAVKFKALQEKARDIGDMTKFIDLQAVTMNEDGTVDGLDAQFDELKKNKAYLFESEAPQNNNRPLNPPAGGGNVLSEKEKYLELKKIVMSNPNNQDAMLNMFRQKSKLKE